MEIELREKDIRTFYVYFKSRPVSKGVHLGTFEQDVDGYYYFWNSKMLGSFASYALRMIADKLDEVNKPWTDKINNDELICPKK